MVQDAGRLARPLQLPLYLPPAVANLLDRLLHCCTGLAAFLLLVTDFVFLTAGHPRTILLTRPTRLHARHRFVPLWARFSRASVEKTTKAAIGSAALAGGRSHRGPIQPAHKEHGRWCRGGAKAITAGVTAIAQRRVPRLDM